MQLESKADLVPNLVRGHRPDGRCRYDTAAKRELLRGVMEPDVSLAGTALAHGINANLLRKWVIRMSGRLHRTARTRVISTTSAPLPVQLDATRPARAIERSARLRIVTQRYRRAEAATAAACGVGRGAQGQGGAVAPLALWAFGGSNRCPPGAGVAVGGWRGVGSTALLSTSHQ